MGQLLLQSFCCCSSVPAAVVLTNHKAAAINYHIPPSVKKTPAISAQKISNTYNK